MLSVWIWVCYFFISVSLSDSLSTAPADWIEELKSSQLLAQKAIEIIFAKWQVRKYPKFLKSCWMEKVSWDILKLKYQKQLLARFTDPSSNNVQQHGFVVSFTGSSVTAGHDSKFEEAFPSLVNSTMAPIFREAGISLHVRNVAVGNNPCMPYDVCVKAFAGNDADIVVWEQTYNCGHGNHKATLEQFMRQALLFPSRPVVVYSDSETKNWKKDKCPSPVVPHEVTPEERDLLSSSPEHIVTVLNGPEYRKWGHISEAVHSYPFAGAQAFTHSQHWEYRCQGPFDPNWGAGAASWHPSRLGHQWRAAQFSYVWLAAWNASIAELLTEITAGVETMTTTTTATAAAAMAKRVTSKLVALQDWYGYPVLPKALHSTNITDGMHCWTDYEPRVTRNASLVSRVIGGALQVHEIQVDDNLLLRADAFANFSLSRGIVATKGCPSSSLTSTSSSTSSGSPPRGCWHSEIYEFIGGAKMGALRHIAFQGYKDFKFILHGTSISGPLTLRIDVVRAGPVFVCEPPYVSRPAPVENQKLWEAYITPLSPLSSGASTRAHTHSTSPTKSHPSASVSASTSTSTSTSASGVVSGNHSVDASAQMFVFDEAAPGTRKMAYFHDKAIEICWQVEEYLPPGSYALTLRATSEHHVYIAYVLTP